VFDNIIHWPVGGSFGFDSIRAGYEPLGLVGRDTPIGSIGSCFAREIKHYLVERGYNYVVTSNSPNAKHSSAAWDRVYNTFCLRQEAQRAHLGGLHPKHGEWETERGTFDPYRQDVRWESPEHKRAELAEHARDARRAFTSCDVFIITVGLNEVWFASDGFAAYQRPPRTVLKRQPDEWDLLRPSVAENALNLCGMIKILRRMNPKIVPILTLSPVPLQASFFENVIVANALSKATLLAAVREACRKTGAHYFPAYEVVTSIANNPFTPEDNRHVRKEVVERVMRLFEWMFVR
jgi:hypothetical protein